MRSIAFASGHIRWKDAIQFINLSGRQRDVNRRRILFQVLAALRAGNRNEVVAFGKHPCERELAWSNAPYQPPISSLCNQFQVAGEVLSLKARTLATVIVSLEILGASDSTCEETSSQGAVGYEADA